MIEIELCTTFVYGSSYANTSIQFDMKKPNWLPFHVSGNKDKVEKDKVSFTGGITNSVRNCY